MFEALGRYIQGEMERDQGETECQFYRFSILFYDYLLLGVMINREERVIKRL